MGDDISSSLCVTSTGIFCDGFDARDLRDLFDLFDLCDFEGLTWIRRSFFVDDAASSSSLMCENDS